MRTFTVKEFCDFVRVKPSTLRAWRSRGLFTPELHKRKGAWTVYTVSDIHQVNRLRQRLKGLCPHCGESFL